MPALNEAQRKRQRMLQKQREEAYAASMRPKPGQKGQQTGAQGAASKGETIGGAPQRVRVKNPAKSKQLTADEARTPKVEAGKGDPEFRRPKPAEKQPAKPAMRAAQQPTTATKAPAAKPAEKPKAPVSTASTYRDPSDTKGLSVGRYRTLEEHRAAVQANKALKIGSKFDKTMDVYTPSTKMEGKEMDTSKVTAKTEEYNKKKRKNLK
jgi:ribosomal protein L13E